MNILRARQLWMHTSVYLEQIFEIASLTSICDSVKPDVSIMRRHDITENALRDICGFEVKESGRLQMGRRNLDVEAMANFR